MHLVMTLLHSGFGTCVCDAAGDDSSLLYNLYIYSSQIANPPTFMQMIMAP